MGVEKRILLAAEPLKKAVEEFDGAEFSMRLYARLGIVPEETGQGVEANHRKVASLHTRGHGDQGQHGK
ncbi:hypothetical protein ACIOJE_27515 [Kitasatospora sp. NPDC087861]|uniref:hypothetical protein n=1 Tax=Kitasatospora sp. NPDC087861 TaxID=3364070 RepID=UPI00382429A0